MTQLEELQKQRDYYDKKMGEVLNGKLHLKKNGVVIKKPLSEEQKKKDLFLYKFYEFHFNRLERLIEEEIYSS